MMPALLTTTPTPTPPNAWCASNSEGTVPARGAVDIGQVSKVSLGAESGSRCGAS